MTEYNSVHKDMVYPSSLDLIGKTPLVKLAKLSEKYHVNFYLKLESHSLTGSVKDRPALKMVEMAEKSGKLKPGMTIIESSSGNLGEALSAICSIKGYKFICVTDPKTSVIRINIIKAYGGKVIKVNKKGKNGSYIENRIKMVKKLLKLIPGSVNLDQYNNPFNLLVHYETTGPEIYNDLNNKVDAVAGCLSTSGTMMGIAKFFKEKKSKTIMVGVEPVGSILFGGKYKPYLQQGPGISFFPKLYNPSLLDVKIKINDRNAFDTARLIAREEGLLVGASSGAAICASVKLVKEHKGFKNIVIIAPDNGDKYLNSFFSDAWYRKKGLQHDR